MTYFSQTGNTRKVAEAIYEALDREKTLLPIGDVQNADEYDLIYIGFPVQSHSVPYKAENFLRNIPPHKKIALFSTHGSLTGSRLSREAIEHASVLASRAKVLGTFSCRGRVSMSTLEALSKSPEHEAWAEMAASAGTHPDEHDLEDARTFARWVITLSRQEHS